MQHLLLCFLFVSSVLCVWTPVPGTTWNWQLNQPIDTTINVQVLDVDLFETPATTIATLHSQGKKVICYFSSQYENWRPDASSFPPSVIGAPIDGWEGENWVDVSKLTILEPIMAARLDIAVSKGCDGVEPDNVDGYANENGFGTTAAQQLAFNIKLSQLAHARGLAVGLKNDLDQVEALVSYFDFAVNEQCFQYTECDLLAPFVAANKAVFNCEYKGTAASFTTNVCPSAVAQGISAIFKKLALTAPLLAACQTSPSSPSPTVPTPSTPTPAPMVCSGTVCPVPSSPCQKAACSSTGKCTTKNIVGSCNDGNSCTKDDTCSKGVCKGKAISGCTPAANEGTVAQDTQSNPDLTTTPAYTGAPVVPAWGIGLLVVASVVVVLLFVVVILLVKQAKVQEERV